MRPKYSTRGIVLSRYPAGEANASLAILTHDFGLVRARVQGVRKPGAKMAPALQTLSEADLMLVRGKDGWRLSGAVLHENWFRTLSATQRACAGRVASLILRLVGGESADPSIYSAFSEFLAALANLSNERMESAEILVALRIIRALGLDAGELAQDALSYDERTLAALSGNRRDFILRVNQGIKASGL
jgi:DNA repair protein RecO